MSRPASFPERVAQDLLTEFRKPIWRPFMKAIRRYRLIEPGDRIAVCVSGGKDSMLLAKLMQLLEAHSEVPFEAKALIMDPGYSPENRHQVEENARKLGIPYTLVESDVFEAAASQEKHTCFLCARMRRGCLYRHAQAMGCNKIALGHHFDDVVETTLISMLYGGQIQGMLPRVRAKNFPGMQLIRPMYMVREDDILAWRDRCQLTFLQCACRFTEEARRDPERSKRQEVKRLLRRLSETNPNVYRNLFGSLHALQLDTIPAWKFQGEEHSFLEWCDGEE